MAESLPPSDGSLGQVCDRLSGTMTSWQTAVARIKDELNAIEREQATLKRDLAAEEPTVKEAQRAERDINSTGLSTPAIPPRPPAQQGEDGGTP